MKREVKNGIPFPHPGSFVPSLLMLFKWWWEIQMCTIYQWEGRETDSEQRRSSLQEKQISLNYWTGMNGGRAMADWMDECWCNGRSRRSRREASKKEHVSEVGKSNVSQKKNRDKYLMACGQIDSGRDDDDSDFLFILNLRFPLVISSLSSTECVWQQSNETDVPSPETQSSNTGTKKENGHDIWHAK